MDLKLFIKKLSERKSSSLVWNPYRKKDQRSNLQVYFSAMLLTRPTVLLVGEAPGYRGCSLSGIPFTSPGLLRAAPHPFLQSLKAELNLPDGIQETTASVLWEYLQDTSLLPLFWNAFPFHPHKIGSKDSNRKPLVSEFEEGLPYLKWVIEIFEPEVFVGVGRSGESALNRILPGVKIPYVRHPSHGGAREFRTGMDELFVKSKYSG